MRLEKHHSLSYQLMTRTSVPSMTLVWSMWKVDEWLSWLKSIETLGWSVQPRMPLSWFAAASFTALLISSLSVLRLATNLKSIIETLGVGTRIATPSSLPFSSGSTKPTAFAAPVEVGIIDSAAARARRRSLCGRSSSCWSLVYEWIVVICAERIPNFSWTTFATGARQFVVHDA